MTSLPVSAIFTFFVYSTTLRAVETHRTYIPCISICGHRCNTSPFTVEACTGISSRCGEASAVTHSAWITAHAVWRTSTLLDRIVGAVFTWVFIRTLGAFGTVVAKWTNTSIIRGHVEVNECTIILKLTNIKWYDKLLCDEETINPLIKDEYRIK